MSPEKSPSSPEKHWGGMFLIVGLGAVALVLAGDILDMGTAHIAKYLKGN